MENIHAKDWQSSQEQPWSNLQNEHELFSVDGIKVSLTAKKQENAISRNFIYTFTIFGHPLKWSQVSFFVGYKKALNA